MATQVQHLQEELIRAEATLGKDAPWVSALRQQLGGYRSMDANREQRFLTGAIPKSDSASETDLIKPAQDAIEEWGEKTFNVMRGQFRPLKDFDQ